MKWRRRLTAALLAVALFSGCAQIHEASDRAREADAVEQAAIRRIVVVRGTAIPEHPYFVRLGVVGGHCAMDQESDDDVPYADSLRRSAYMKFGEAADAVVEARAWFVSHAIPSSVYETSGGGGELYTAGTAVQFINDPR